MPDNQDPISRWMSGESLPKVAFAHNQSVEVQSGPLKGTRGAIVTIITFDPEPLYVVELSSGKDQQLYQSALRPAT
jgi:hypothetical protein